MDFCTFIYADLYLLVMHETFVQEIRDNEIFNKVVEDILTHKRKEF